MTAATDGTVTLGDDGNGTGHIIVTGSNSLLDVTAGQVWVGGSSNADGNDGTGILDIENGGTVTVAGQVVLGQGLNSASVADGTVTVTGTDSTLNANDRLAVGWFGIGTLNVAAGGTVNAGDLIIADEAGSSGTMSITGNTSTVNVDGVVIVGEAQSGSLTISGGAQLFSALDDATGTTGIIGSAAAADGATVTVDGEGSLWDHAGTNNRLSVGVFGGANVDGQRTQLTVTNGGAVVAHDFFVVDAGGYAEVLIDGADGQGTASSITTEGTAIIGDAGGTGVMTISNGGQFTSPNSIEIGGISSGTGVATVTGAGSLMSTQLALNVGRTGDATLNIADGGTVLATTTTNISRDAASLSTATVGSATSDASTWDNLADLNVGGDTAGAGGTATLNVNTGGVVNVATTLKIWNAGTVNLNGGTINTTALDVVDAGAPVLDFTSGTFRYTGNAMLNDEAIGDLLGDSATLASDQHLAVVGTATVDSALRLNGGELSVGVIDQASAAMLDLDAGTFNLTASNLVVGGGGQFGNVTEFNSATDLNVSQQITVQDSGVFSTGGNVSANNITNNGAMTHIGGDTVIGGTVTNNDRISVLSVSANNVDYGTERSAAEGGAGLAQIDNAGDLVLSNVEVIADIQALAGSSITVIGEAVIWGTLSGSTDIFGPGTTTFLGDLNVGNSPGALMAEGSIDLSRAGIVVIELGGKTPVTEHDTIHADEILTLGGILEVALVDDVIDDYIPALGDVFQLFTAAAIEGSFADIWLPILDGGARWLVHQSATGLSLQVAPVPVPGAMLLFAPALAIFGFMRRRVNPICGA